MCLVVAAILWPDLAISSAPADFEADCINDPDNPVPPGHRRIFDTYSYEELFDRRNPILETLNTDGGSGVSFATYYMYMYIGLKISSYNSAQSCMLIDFLQLL